MPQEMASFSPAPSVAYQLMALASDNGECAAAHPTGLYGKGANFNLTSALRWILHGSENHQHAGPKLSGYPTSTATSATVAQNTRPGFLRSVMGTNPIPPRRLGD